MYCGIFAALPFTPARPRAQLSFFSLATQGALSNHAATGPLFTSADPVQTCGYAARLSAASLWGNR